MRCRIPKSDLPEGFYVYFFLRKDGTPYYVGKGHGKRAFDESRTWHPRDLSRVQLVETGLPEAAAFELEKTLITEYGRKDLGTGVLRNRSAGGDGSAGHRWNDEQRRRLSQARLGNHNALGKRWKVTAMTRQRVAEARRGEKNPAAKLTMRQVAAIRKRLAAGEKQKPLAVEYKVSFQLISQIKRGEVWQ